jgi:hypothetical protein
VDSELIEYAVRVLSVFNEDALLCSDVEQWLSEAKPFLRVPESLEDDSEVFAGGLLSTPLGTAKQPEAPAKELEARRTVLIQRRGSLEQKSRDLGAAGLSLKGKLSSRYGPKFFD